MFHNHICWKGAIELFVSAEVDRQVKRWVRVEAESGVNIDLDQYENVQGYVDYYLAE